MLVEDTKHPRVQAHAAAAMVNFCEECPPKILEPYLDGLVDALENVLTSKMQEVILFIIYIVFTISHHSVHFNPFFSQWILSLPPENIRGQMG